MHVVILKYTLWKSEVATYKFTGEVTMYLFSGLGWYPREGPIQNISANYALIVDKGDAMEELSAYQICNRPWRWWISESR